MDVSIIIGILTGLILPLCLMISKNGIRTNIFLPAIILGILINIWTGYFPSYTLIVAIVLMVSILFMPSTEVKHE